MDIYTIAQKFPLYRVRARQDIHRVDPYVIIDTRISRYILDNPYLDGNYPTRRLKLDAMKENLPYAIYPLRGRIDSIEQLVSIGKGEYIDNEGKLWEWKPSTFYPIEYKKIINHYRGPNGKYNVWVKDVPHAFLVSDKIFREKVHTHLSVIKLVRGYLLYGVSSGVGARKRIKI